MPLRILKALEYGTTFLKQNGIEDPKTESELFLGNVVNKSRAQLYLDGKEPLSFLQKKKFENFLDQRVKRKPVAYITGETEFFGLKFKITRDVLIPRPETEILVEKVLELLKKTGIKKLHIVDIGTGSGNIAIALAKNLENSVVFATDISQKALQLAAKNAILNRVDKQIKFLWGDLFSPLEKLSLEGNLDCVISNPPYIKKEEFKVLPVDVRKYEPKVALLDKEDGLYFHKRIIENAFVYLKNQGLLALEVAFGQAAKVADLLLQSRKYKLLEVASDLSGIKRVVLANKI